MSNKIFDKIDGFIVNNRETLSLLARNLTIVFVFSLALQIFGLVSVNQYLNLNWLAFGVFSIDTIALIYYFRTLHKLDIQMFEQRHKILNEFFKYGFLVLLGFVTLTQFFKFEWAKEYNIILTIITVFFGVITFYQNKEVIEEIEEETNKEQLEEEKRKGDFSNKFPTINKIPVFRSLVKWMYKEGWVYSVLLLVIISYSFMVRINNISHVYLNVDESIIGLAVKGILNTGFPIMPSGVVYQRDMLTTFIVSIGGLIFGINEVGLRIMSIIFGVGVLVVFYFITKNFLPKY